ncbi:MAG: hypothetical protein V7752_17550 [Halopseudomonas sp.]
MALLNDLLLQLNGFNNGNITAAQTIMVKHGWKDSTRKRALKKLVDSGLLVVTRVGGKHRCCLYAVTWLPIDEIKQADLGPTHKPLIDFNGENKRKASFQKR